VVDKNIIPAEGVPLIRIIDGRVLLLVAALPSFTPRVARDIASEMLRVADIIEPNLQSI
jgi:hypothetical protein